MTVARARPNEAVGQGAGGDGVTGLGQAVDLGQGQAGAAALYMQSLDGGAAQVGLDAAAASAVARWAVGAEADVAPLTGDALGAVPDVAVGAGAGRGTG